MILNLLLAMLVGVVWLNLLVMYLFSKGFIYRYISRKGILHSSISLGSKLYLMLLGVFVVFYLVIVDLVVLGYNERSFAVVFLVNCSLVAVLVSYQIFVVNQWLLVVVRPLFLKVSKLMTPVTILSFSRYVAIRGSVAGIGAAMIGGWIYLYINWRV